MEKTLGIDLGTNSIGLTIRDDDEFSWYGVYTFKKGVGEGKSGEFSFAAERTKHRSSRRLYNARRYRKWETLKVLIDNDFCPLSIENLNNWKHYTKGSGRTFPINDLLFQQWIKLDFNGDNIPDYSSPYQLRKLLITERLDLSIPENRYKIGRALFHIAQRRGFKSSRKSGVNEKTAVYNGSNETKTIGRNEYENLIIEHKSLGAAFAALEDQGIRIRNRYTLRSDYQLEVQLILDFQQIANKTFCDCIIKAIFFQRPLRSQKGLIGKCTLEPNKARCSISHPKFEEYRAWSFINNIKYRNTETNKFEPIPLALKEKLYNDKFFYKSKRDFPFKEIRKYISANGGKDWELNYETKMDEISVPSCFVSARLKSVFGEDWEKYQKQITRKNKKGEIQTINYSIEDIWHLLFSFEDEEYFIEFLTNELKLSEEQIKELTILFNAFPVGYANLSIKAINNILPFLREGIIYSESVILAKIPEIIGKDLFSTNKTNLLQEIQDEVEEIRNQKTIVNITNNLIFKYYALDFEQRFAWKNKEYILTQDDLNDVNTACIEHFGEKTWLKLESKEKESVISKVTDLYQKFFNSDKREHYSQPHLVNRIKEFLVENFGVTDKTLNKIYHPSQIDIYPKKEGQQFLLSPKTAAFKNPMAYKTLYRLKDVINYLIEKNYIDSETRIVVEIARELNDSNKRWAIEKYQRDREVENREFEKAIQNLRKTDYTVSDVDIDKVRLLVEQNPDYMFNKNRFDAEQNEKYKGQVKDFVYRKNEEYIKKYRLWLEQGMQCIYTGKVINLTNLFDENTVDFEHTIPRSKSFDNSLANLTVCDAYYNRNIKSNKLPTELPNYGEESNGYSAIKPRLEKWEDKVKQLQINVDFWKVKSRNAKDKDEKDSAIRQRHLWQMELNYWQNKLDRFTRTNIPQGFINNQLTETQIITKYAFHYLKTVFGKVDVLKGTNTAQFRKIYSIQPKNEVKDRSSHEHHAIDAAVLTLIPSAKKREEILKKAYEFEENNPKKQYHEKPFSAFNYSMIEEIKRNILINNLADKDQTLTQGKRIVRKRGRVIWIDKENRIPKVAQGDSIRGELHMQTYYGKIRMVQRDNEQKPIRTESGDWKYLTDDKEYKFALRIPIESLSDTKNIVDPFLAKMIDTQLNGRTLKRAISEGLYMFDQYGNKVNKIRRIRVWQAVVPMSIKKQTYKSSKEYKNYYYAKNAENTAFGLYKNDSGDTIVISRNLFEISTFDKPNTIKDLKEVFEPQIKNKNNNYLPLFHVFVPGQKVVFYENNKEELKEVGNLSNHLYFVRRLYQASRGNIQFQHHLDARDDKQLLVDFPEKDFGKKGINGFSKFSTNFIAPRLLLSPSKFNFIIEGKDFEMKLDGSIEFKF